MGTIDTNKIVSQYIYIHSSTPFFYESYFFICTQSKSCQIAIYFQAFCFGFSFLKIFFKKGRISWKIHLSYVLIRIIQKKMMIKPF